jgi:hypothetical protein
VNNPARRRRIVRLSTEREPELPSTPSVPPVKEENWTKLAIANVLNREYQDKDVRVWVENVDYGVWIWDDENQVHNHTKVKDLRKTLGKDDADLLVSALDRVQYDWPTIRSWKGVEL